jgi:hypothetical protein
LSYESLTSYDAREKLRGLKLSDPTFHEELLAGSEHVEKIEVAQEDDPNIISTADFEDDSNLPCKAVIASVLMKPLPLGVVSTAHGLVSAAEAEVLDEGSSNSPVSNEEKWAEPEERGVGKRKRRANVMYNSKNFWRHMDGDKSDDESYM